MKKLLLTIATAAIMLFSANKTYASVPEELDQSNLISEEGAASLDFGYSFGQTFTCGITGELSLITIGLNNPATGSYTISIYNGVGNGGAILLNSQPVSLNSVGMNSIPLPAGINVTSGNQYTFILTNIDDVSATFLYSILDPYAGGDGGQALPSPYTILTGVDLVFSTYVIPAPTGPTTQLSTSCGATGLLKNSIIYANAIPGAGKYKFTFSNGQSFTTGNYSPRMALTSISGLQYGQTYGVTVQAYVGGVLTSAGTSCDITLAAFPTTQLSTLSCDATGLTPTSTIYCNAVSGATKYQFVFNGVTSYTTTNDSPRMALNSISGLQYGQTYAVTVKAYAGGVWGTAGSSCDITLAAAPTSQLSGTSCNMPVTKTSIIYANGVAGGYRYKFNVTDNGTYTRSFITGNTLPQTSLSNFPGLVDGTAYQVTVQAYVGGVWGIAGTPCYIFVGGLARAANTEEVAVVENNNEIISQEIAQVISEEVVTEEIKTAPAVEETSTINTASKAEFTAYPNPVSKSSILNISFNTEEIGKVILMDVTGRIITEQNFNTNLNSVVEIDLADKKLDNGIYNLSIIGNKSTAQKTIVVVE
ncbi:MAG: T9SS type A sorting domain-containing protein [Bacteroidota bacterium]